MRSIKFRVWTPKKKEMSGGMPLAMLAGFLAVRYPNLDDEIYLQFTGLHDKNGEEIYEGDLLITHDYIKPIKSHNFEIKWCESEVSFKLFDGIQSYVFPRHPPMLEVIGNIHENQEILK